MCEKAVKDDPSSLQHVPDWFVTQQQLDVCFDDVELIEWYESYKKRNAQKAQIKKELMRVASHPSRYWDCCFPEDEKKETEKLWA